MTKNELFTKYKSKKKLIEVLLKINEEDGNTEQESIKMIDNFLMQNLMQ